MYSEDKEPENHILSKFSEAEEPGSLTLGYGRFNPTALSGSRPRDMGRPVHESARGKRPCTIQHGVGLDKPVSRFS